MMRMASLARAMPGARTIFIHEYVTGGGLAGQEAPRSLAREGSAMRRAVATDFAALEHIRVVMTLDASLTDAPGPWVIVRVEPGAEPEIAKALASEADWTLVIAPETGGILAERARWIDEAGGRTLGATPEAITRTGDKLALAHLLHDANLAHPPTRLVTGPGPWPFETSPCAVLKPRDGAGCLHTVRSEITAGLPANYPWPAIVQPYVPGTAFSVSILVDIAGRAWPLAIGRQRVVEREGTFRYEGGEIPCGPREAIAEACRAVEVVSGLHGWVGVDLVVTEDSRPVILEINPRLTTSFVGLARLAPAGGLANCWLSCLAGSPHGEVVHLANILAQSPPVSFRADGSLNGKARGNG
jgi:predicted ATP-grasp superfamily ATP-dependent carboligase